jgi:ribose 5-phosphate isomerase A
VSRRTTGDGIPFRTDQGHFILDCTFGPIGDPHGLGRTLADRAGIVEHGLFLGLATDLVIAGSDGIRHLRNA